jgi:mannose-1-phosphate guanylyltransferase / mannose-6-phosphate isomerase
MATLDARPLIPVVLAGGRGTRLWPLSRESLSKQFLPLVARDSMFQQTLLRTSALPGLTVARPIVVANAGQRDLVLSQAHAVGIEPDCVVLEPAGRNTAPAVAIAALLARRDGDTDPLLLVVPADHAIADTAAFAAAVRAGSSAAAEGRLVTFGIVPEQPETGYGYIQRGEAHGEWDDIGRFVEKPDLATAKSYLRSGDYLWNSGIFLFSARRLLEELAAHAAPVLAGCERALAMADAKSGTVELGAAFLDVPSISIDYAVMEKTVNGAVVSMAVGWSDVGSWSALHDIAKQDEQGNSSRGDAVLESCTNTFVVAGKRLVVAIGVDDVVIVESHDAVLVMHRDRAQDVSRIVERLKNEGRGPR